MKAKILIDDDWLVDTVWEPVLTKVVLVAFGIRASGTAKWNKAEDEYNPVVGEAIAYARALTRWSAKWEKQLVRNT